MVDSQLKALSEKLKPVLDVNGFEAIFKSSLSYVRLNESVYQVIIFSLSKTNKIRMEAFVSDKNGNNVGGRLNNSSILSANSLGTDRTWSLDESEKIYQVINRVLIPWFCAVDNCLLS